MQNKDLAQLLQALSENGIRYCNRQTIPENPAPAAAFDHPFYQPHRHRQLELICLLEGALALRVNGDWTLPSPDQPTAFLPGAEHTEHYFDQDTPYRMLWATVLPASIILHITSHDPLTGYGKSRKRMAITPPMCGRLWEVAGAEDFDRDRRQAAKFHFLLMECLCFTLEDPGGAGRQGADCHEQVVEQVKSYVTSYYWEDLSLRKLAAITHYSPGHLNAIFRHTEKIPLHRYISEIRLQKARNLLLNEKMLVKQAALATGFQDPLYFSRLFRRRFGACPSASTDTTKRTGNNKKAPAPDRTGHGDRNQ